VGGLISQWVTVFAQRLRKRGSIALLILVPATSAHPQDMQSSFVEFKDEKQTTTYDLRTVEVIQPGKFVVVETVLGNPDVMRFELKVLDTLRSHCARQAGSYPAPAEVFTLGPPDMPLKDIEVQLQPTGTKIVFWLQPYTKTMVGNGSRIQTYLCNPKNHNEIDEYWERRNVILNGAKNRVLFDCNRGLMGDLFDNKLQVYTVPKGTVGELYYYRVCKAVTKKDPYLSE
jgi:hypothetical protein